MTKHEHPSKKRVPLWKWLVIILLVIAMPLFFSYYRDVQIEQVFGPNDPYETPNNQEADNNS